MASGEGSDIDGGGIGCGDGDRFGCESEDPGLLSDKPVELRVRQMLIMLGRSEASWAQQAVCRAAMTGGQSPGLLNGLPGLSCTGS